MTALENGLYVIELSTPQIPRMNLVAVENDKNELTLIDSGLPNVTDRIFDYLESVGKDPLRIENLILTHFDTDHMGSAAEIKSRTKCKVVAYGFDADIISGSKFEEKELRDMFPEYTSQEIEKLSEKVQESIADRVKVDQVVRGVRQFSLGEEVTIFHTPGHTPGHITVFLGRHNALVTGDALTVSDDKVGSPTPQYTVSVKQGIESLKALSTLNFEVLIPYHAPPIFSGGNLELRKYVETTERI